MENKSHALTAGLFTLLLIAAAVFVALWLNRDRTDYVPYHIVTTHSIPGLNPQAEVRYRGLEVGRVENITFDPREPGRILIHIGVQPDTPITLSTYASLGFKGVTGIAYVELNDTGASDVHLPSSEENIARIEMRPHFLDALQNRGLVILEQIEELSKRINTLVSPDNEQVIVEAFANVSKAAAALEKIPQQLQPTLVQMPEVMKQAQKSLASLSELAQELNQLANDLDEPEGAIDKFAEAAERVRSMAEQIEREAIPLATDARRSLRNIDRTLENFNNSPRRFLFGAGSQGRAPGPGEEGFAAPSE